ncbi:MAG: transcription antitermination factor NusB [Byssovorax sp.]
MARALAAEVLVRVWTEEAFAAAALDNELRRAGEIDPRDAGLATELVYGVLRAQGFLDEQLALFAAHRSPPDDPRVLAHLRMAVYTLAFLDRVPTFAAVSEAVAGVRAAGGDRMSGFANAILRRLATEYATRGRPSLEEAIAASAPGWLRGALRRAIGRGPAAAYLAAGPVPPPIGLCLALGEDRARWIEALRAAAPGAEIEAGKVSPQAILVRGSGDVRRLPGHGEAWIIQEEGAQVVALAAGARPGEAVLDACSGRGNKTWIFGQRVRPGGAADAADLHAPKLERLRAGSPGAFARKTFTVDWTEGTGDVPIGYDRVIVDAPCSGTGTLRRRPEIGQKREQADLARLAALQEAIVRRAATRVKDGGRLIYAVCSVLREEAEAVVGALIAGEGAAGDGGPQLSPAPFDSEIGRALAGEGTMFRVMPQDQGTDGYFVASFVVRGGERGG